jgi:hypothetical protein
MGWRRGILLAAWTLILLPGAAGVALGSEGAGAGPAKLSDTLRPAAAPESPEPYAPSIREPPPGSEIRPWKTWTTGQDIDFLPRVTLQLNAGMQFPCGGTAETTTNKFEYDKLWESDGAFSLDLVVNLTPNLGLGLRAMMIHTPDAPDLRIHFNGAWRDGDITNNVLGGFFLTSVVKFPLASSLSSFFRVDSTEDWQGIAPVIRLGAGFVTMFGQDAEFENAYGGQLFVQSRTFGWMATAGIELKIWHLGLSLECGLVDFGEPQPARDTDYGYGVFTRVDRLLRVVALGSLAISF